jgi:conjugal transfer pilus assembly protein TraE
METTFRDDAIARTRLMLKLAIAWGFSSSLAVIALSVLCWYAVKHRETHWLPLCTGSELSIGERSYSPSYLKEMTLKVADLRLTYNPETINPRYEQLVHLVPANQQEAFKKVLEPEVATVKEKNISSVFYTEKVEVDVAKHAARIEGLLYRTSHHLQLNPERKIFVLQFSFSNGLLWPQSIKEISE